MDQRLVGVHDLFEIDRALCDMGECRPGVVVGVQLPGGFLIERAVGVDAGEDAAGEVSAHGYEVDLLPECGFQQPEVAADFEQMLVREGLVDGEVRGAPAEMGRGRGLHAGAGRTGDGRDVHLVFEQPRCGQRQQRQLDRGGETARIGHAAGLPDALAVHLRESVDEPFGLVAEILREVDDPQPFGQLLFRHPRTALSVRRAEEDDVDRREVVLRAEVHRCFALQPAVDLREEVPGVGGAVYEGDLDLRVVHQQADQLPGRVSGPSDDSRADHFLFFSLRFWTL